ncbi:MAG: hypothetical protein KH230_25400 [Enterocloster asparagiformis]|nr:hypothetical protein [Enterocloster asparagiformis]
MGYEDLLEEAKNAGIIVKEKPLPLSDGRICGMRIAIRQDIPTLKKKADVLAEELGHYYTTVGDIIDQDSAESRKQERIARLWAFNKRIALEGIIQAFEHHCENQYEVAEYLDVSEDTLAEALEYYRQIYGTGVWIENYHIQFEPYLQVGQILLFNK